MMMEVSFLSYWGSPLVYPGPTYIPLSHKFPLTSIELLLLKHTTLYLVN